MGLAGGGPSTMVGDGRVAPKTGGWWEIEITVTPLSLYSIYNYVFKFHSQNIKSGCVK